MVLVLAMGRVKGIFALSKQRKITESQSSFRDAETTIILIKFARFGRGFRRGKIYRKLSKNAVFPGKFHDNKIGKFCEFYCQKFCCHLGGSYSSARQPNTCSMFTCSVSCPSPMLTRATLCTLAHRNRSDFCDLRLRCPSRTPEIARFPRQETAMMHCHLRVRWKVASDLRFRAAISEPQTPSFCGISGDLAPSTRKSLAIAIVRFWSAKLCTILLKELNKEGFFLAGQTC